MRSRLSPYDEAVDMLRSQAMDICKSAKIDLRSPLKRGIFDGIFDNLIRSPQAQEYINAAISQPPESVDAVGEVLSEQATEGIGKLTSKLKAKLTEKGIPHEPVSK